MLRAFFVLSMSGCVQREMRVLMYVCGFRNEEQDEKGMTNNYQAMLVPISYTPFKC